MNKLSEYPSMEDDPCGMISSDYWQSKLCKLVASEQEGHWVLPTAMAHGPTSCDASFYCGHCGLDGKAHMKYIGEDVDGNERFVNSFKGEIFQHKCTGERHTKENQPRKLRKTLWEWFGLR
jgi:hypothetical protein